MYVFLERGRELIAAQVVDVVFNKIILVVFRCGVNSYKVPKKVAYSQQP